MKIVKISGAKIKNAVAKYSSLKEASKHLGITEAQLWILCQKLKIQVRRYVSEEDVRECKKKYTYVEAAKQLGINKATLYRHYRKYNLINDKN